MVQEVGHDDEERRLAALEAAVGDGGGDVGLAGAGGAVDEQPAGGLLGEGAGIGREAAELLLVAAVDAAAALDQVGEAETGEGPEGAEALETPEAALLRLVANALAGHRFAEVGVVQGQVAAKEAGAAADRAGRLNRRRRRFGLRAPGLAG